MRVLFSPRGRLVTAGAVVLVAVSASIAYAAIPDAGSQTFSACVLNGVGTVRLIDKAKSGITGRCTDFETAVSWNAKGQPGATGLPGASGDAGAPGTKGDTGAQGPAGDTGPAGRTGDTGAPGAKGGTGDTGDTGPIGHKGDPGARGPQGDKGDTGAIGPAGVDGQPGATGAKGPSGAPGDRGPQGQAGAPGATGATGPAGADGTNNVWMESGTGTGAHTVTAAGFDVPVSQGGLYIGLGEARVTALDGEVTIQCAIFGGAQRIADTFTTSGTYSTHQLMSVVNVPKLSGGGVFTSSLQCTDLGNTGRRFSVTATFELEKVGSVASFDQ